MRNRDREHRPSSQSVPTTDPRDRGSSSWHEVIRGYRPKSSPENIVPPTGGTGAIPGASTGSEGSGSSGGGSSRRE